MVRRTKLAVLCLGIFTGTFLGCSSEPELSGVITGTQSGTQASIDTNGDKLVYVEDCSNNVPSLKKASDLQTSCITFDRTYSIVNVQGTALDGKGAALKKARIRLSSSYSSVQETTTDDEGVYKFADVAYKAVYRGGYIPFEEGNFQILDDTSFVTYFDYTLQVVSSDSTLASVNTINFENYKRVSEGDSVYLEIPDQTALKTQDVELKTYNFKKGDKVCLDKADICQILSEDEVSDGVFIMKNVPQGIYTQLCTTRDEGNGIMSSSCVYLSETLITKPVLDSMSYALPESAVTLMDSLEDQSVENILVSVKTSAERPFMVNGRTVTKLISAGSKDLYWAEVSVEGGDTANYILLDDIASKQNSNVIAAKESLQDTLMDNAAAYWNRAEIGFSFKVKAAGSDLETAAVLFSTVDSTKSGLPRGYEVRQCEAGSSNVCVRIYSGLEAVVTDTVVYGKTDILDGEEHIFSMAMMGNHLSVAVDGTILRDTDIKVGEDFPYFTGKKFVSVGEVELKNFLMFNVNYNIRKSGEVNWNRLKAWLITHQTYSK